MKGGEAHDYALERLLANADSGRYITVSILNIQVTPQKKQKVTAGSKVGYF